MSLREGFATLITRVRLLSSMGSPVHNQIRNFSECFVAHFADTGLLASVYTPVYFESIRVLKLLATVVTEELGVRRIYVHSLVDGEVAGDGEPLVTLRAGEGLLSRVGPLVLGERGSLPHGLTTHVTDVGLLSRVDAEVDVQPLLGSKRLVTNIALERLQPCVALQMDLEPILVPAGLTALCTRDALVSGRLVHLLLAGPSAGPVNARGRGRGRG